MLPPLLPSVLILRLDDSAGRLVTHSPPRQVSSPEQVSACVDVPEFDSPPADPGGKPRRNKNRNWNPCLMCRAQKLKCVPSPSGTCMRCIDKRFDGCVPCKSLDVDGPRGASELWPAYPTANADIPAVSERRGPHAPSVDGTPTNTVPPRSMHPVYQIPTPSPSPTLAHVDAIHAAPPLFDPCGPLLSYPHPNVHVHQPSIADADSAYTHTYFPNGTGGVHGSRPGNALRPLDIPALWF